MKDFAQLKKNLKKDFSNLKIIKIAILGDTSTQFLVQAIRGYGFDTDFDLKIWEADYNQIDRQVLDLNSELYEFRPEVVIIFQSSLKLLEKYNRLITGQQLLATTELNSIRNIYSTIISQLKTKVIFYNYTEIDDSVFGNYANKTETSFLFQLRKLNYELMVDASQNTALHLCDISTIQNNVGKKVFFQPSIYVNSEMVLSIDVLPLIASKTVDIICALNGKFKKCIVIDLDNTIWGGVIGDDGLENIQLGSLGIGKAFSAFQYWVKKLKHRGVIVAVCSKNTESIAKEPFEKHLDMILQLEDIAVFIANWDNKADNLRQIRNILNIGFDSMVFIDDNAFERNIVRENIPEIYVPELPEDPAEYLEYLYGLNLFETASYSMEDAKRTQLYQIDAQRVSTQQKFANVDDFLESLNMISLVESFNKFSIPRVAQLAQRSNQFNLRTIRYSITEIEALAQSPNHFTFTFTLEDKFGDNGLICVIILQKETAQTLFIDTWFMSCRVLKRGMESFVLNTITNFARQNGFTTLKGEYIQTIKNELVKDHYLALGFDKKDDHWILKLDSFKEQKTYIKAK